MAFRKTALGVVPAVMQACLNFSALSFLILQPRTVICSAMYLLFALRFDSVNAMFYSCSALVTSGAGWCYFLLDILAFWLSSLQSAFSEIM